MRGKSLFRYSLLGCALGAIGFFEPAVLFLSLVALSIILFIRTRSEEDRSNLIKIVFIAFILRLIFFFVSIAYIYFGELHIFEHAIIGRVVGISVQAFRDFQREILNGRLIARYFRGEFGYVANLNEISFGGHGRLHFGAFFLGALNFLFGNSIFNLLFSPIISLWAVILTYYLAKEIFDRYVAVFSSLVVAVLPSFNMWASSNFRMTIGILGILIMAYSSTLFYKENKLKFILPLLVSILIFSVVKEKLLRPTLLIVPFVLFMGLNFKLRFKIILLGLAGAIAFISLRTFGALQYKLTSLLTDMVLAQRGFSTENIRHYKIYDGFVYHAGFTGFSSLTLVISVMLRALPKGISYFLLAPFPWDIDSVLRLYSYPQMIFWYFALGFGLLGICKVAIEKKSDTLPMIYISSFFIILFSLVLGNEGITARFRDMVSPFFYIFAGSVLCKFLPLKQNGDYKKP